MLQEEGVACAPVQPHACLSTDLLCVCACLNVYAS